MRKLISLTALLWMSGAYANECFVFNKIERESQVSALKVTLGPAQNVRGPESFRIAQITVKDASGDDLSGQVGCTKAAPNHWSCRRSDDGGSFDIEVDGNVATFSTAFFVMGSDEDKLTLQSENDDPWVFEGQSCSKSAPAPVKPRKK